DVASQVNVRQRNALGIRTGALVVELPELRQHKIPVAIRGPELHLIGLHACRVHDALKEGIAVRGEPARVATKEPLTPRSLHLQGCNVPQVAASPAALPRSE